MNTTLGNTGNISNPNYVTYNPNYRLTTNQTLTYSGISIEDTKQEFLDIIAEVLGIKSFSDFNKLNQEEREEYKKNLIKSLEREKTLDKIIKKLD